MADLAYLLEVLQNELNDLAVEAKSSRSVDGLAGQLSNLFLVPAHKDVKEAAEAAQVALRGIAKQGVSLKAFQEAKDVVDAVLLACGRSKSLCILGLPILQKLIANNLLSESSCRKAIAMLLHISTSKAHGDENIKLKLLQTCLTILQVPFGIDHLESTRQILALCFHVLSTRNASTVITTASATVRQAVTLVFDHVSSPQLHPASAGAPGYRTPPQSPPRAAASGDSSQPDVRGAADDAGSRFTLHRTATGSCILSPTAGTAAGTAPPGVPPQQQAALLLLKELCLMARGNPSEWLNTKALSATFVLDLLSQVARGHTQLFRSIPAFQETLREDMCGSVMHCVRQQLEADTENVQVGTLRVGLHCLSIILVNYSYLMATRAEMLLTLVLDGCHNATHYAQQVLCMQAMRAVCYSAPVVHFMFTSYDMKLDYKLRAIQSILSTACEFINVFISTAVDNGDAEALQLLSTLWQQKMHNRQLSFEAEFASHASTGYGSMYIVLLAIDTVNALVHSVETIVDHALYPSGQAPSSLDLPDPSQLEPAASGRSEEAPPAAEDGDDGGSVHLMMQRMTGDADGARAAGAPGMRHSASAGLGFAPGASQANIWSQISPTTPEACRILVEAVWQRILTVMSDLIRYVSGEVLVLQLLRCFQAFTQAAGELRMGEPFTSFLSAVCDLTVYEDKALTFAPQRAEASSGDIAPAQPEVEPSPRPRPKAKEGKVLTPKNVHALRTVFNISHRLAEKLGPAWAIVLEALDALDRLLHSPSTTTQQGSGANAAAATNDDLHILSAASSQLFQATTTMSDAAVLSMLQALQGVVQRKLAVPAASQAGAQVRQPNCFALDRMVDILVNNLPRATTFWPLFMEQVVQLSRHDDAVERTAALRILLRASVSSLKGALSAADASATAPAQSAEDALRLEELVVTSLVSLQGTPGVTADVRYAAVEVALHVLQGFGDQLTVGWAPMLSLLEDAASKERESARLVRLAHECLDLVVTDFLPRLPCAHLRRALQVEAAFVKQSVDVNCCYSASLNLWRVADNLGRALRRLRGQAESVSGEALDAAEVDTVPPPQLTASAILASLAQPLTLISSLTRAGASEDNALQAQKSLRGESERDDRQKPSIPAGTSSDMAAPDGSEDDVISQLASSLTYGDCEALLLLVLECAYDIALESRPEIRTSGIKLLFDVMTRHASLLPEQEGKLWRMSFPLVMEVVEHVRQGANAGPSLPLQPLTAESGRVMQVHHSHDSEAKRWLETLEKAIKGWVAYLRGSLAAVLRLPSFASDWDALMAVLEGLICMTSLPGDASGKKVAQASLTFFTSVVAPHAATTTLPEGLWQRSFAALERCAHSLADPATPAHISIRQNFVCTLAAVAAVAESRLSAAMYDALLAALDALAAHPVAAAEKYPVGDVLPPVLVSVLSALPSVLPPKAPEYWPRVVAFFCNQIHAAAALATQGGVPAAAPLGRPAALALLWMEEMVTQLVRLVRDAMPWQQRAASLPACVAALKRAMLLQYSLPSARVWSVAAKQFTVLVSAGLPAVNIAYVNGQAEPVEGVWGDLADAFETFLQGPGTRPRTSLSAAHPGGSPRTPTSLLAAVPFEDSSFAEASTSAGGRDPELEACVLDCLTDSVLASCGHTSSAVRRRLVAILDAGCAITSDSHRSPAHRLSHMCLRKLFVICGRGIQSSGGHAGLLDVATIALPLLLRRCDKTLRQYASYSGARTVAEADAVASSHAAETGADDRPTDATPVTSPAHPPAPPQALTDYVLSVLEVVSSLWLSPVVVDRALPMSASVVTLVRVARQHAAQQQQRPGDALIDGREQTHLIMLYDAVVMCVEGPDRAVHAAVQHVLLQTGKLLAFPSRAWI